MSPTMHGLHVADVAVVGAGPAGIAAAVRAAAAGRRVLVIDQGLRAGGQIWRHRDRASLPRDARAWLDRLDRSGAALLAGASVIDAERRDAAAGFALRVEQGAVVHHVRAASVVLATGARERFLPFPGWTLPGVVGIGGAQALLKQGTSFAGKRVVIAGTGPLLLPVAAALAHGGARVALVAEQARAADVGRFALGLWRRPALVAQAARYRAGFLTTPYALGTWATRAEGDDAVRAVTVTDGARTRTLACDVLCTGYGLVPGTELARLLGCRVESGRVAVDDRQETSVPAAFSAGEATGVGGVELALAEGEIAGCCAAGTSRPEARADARRARALADAAALDRTFGLRPEILRLATDDTVVCRCEDVTLGALRAERSVREAKLFTRAGMGPCQGRVCGAALECLLGWERDVVRLPVEPAQVASLLDESPADADVG